MKTGRQYWNSSVRFWFKHFRSNTLINEIRINRRKAYRFFGILPVHRENPFELHQIWFAQSITLSKVDYLPLMVQEIRSAVIESDGKKDAHAAAVVTRRLSANCFTASINPWRLASPRVIDLDFPLESCVEELKTWAAKQLRTNAV